MLARAASGGAGERPALVEAMLEPGFYPHRPAAVDLRETHISWVFRAGELAYKVKKPVVLPFLDYGTAQRRRRMCLEEVRLNRRLAPSIYLRAAGIRQRRGRYELTSVGDPEAVEYAVEMRTVDEEHSFAALAARGELQRDRVAAVAELLARFHAAAETAGTDPLRLDQFVAGITDNVRTLADAGAGILDRDRLRAAGSFTAMFLAAWWGRLERRLAAGLLRDCHGDLRAEHVIDPPGGAPYVYDCIEFSRRLREIDVAADLAFLVMDLTRLAGDELAAELLHAYRRAGGDPGPPPLVDFLAAYRAWVRATVACQRALELRAGDCDRPPSGREAEGRKREAREYLALGHRFAWRARGPLVLLVCGVSASGKSTLAERLAAVSGWPHLSSDVTRKGLAGIEPTRRGGAALYSTEATARTYRRLGAEARAALAEGGGVIVDATFRRRAERDAFRAGLGEVAAPALAVRCLASPSVLLARAAARERDPARVSDAGPQIVARQLAEWEELDDLPRDHRLDLCTELDPGALATLVERFLDRRLPAG